MVRKLLLPQFRTLINYHTYLFLKALGSWSFKSLSESSLLKGESDIRINAAPRGCCDDSPAGTGPLQFTISSAFSNVDMIFWISRSRVSWDEVGRWRYTWSCLANSKPCSSACMMLFGSPMLMKLSTKV